MTQVEHDKSSDCTHLRAALAQVVGLPVGLLLHLLQGLYHSGAGLLLLLLLLRPGAWLPAGARLGLAQLLEGLEEADDLDLPRLAFPLRL